MNESKPLYSFDGQNGAILVFENKVRISRSGCMAFITQGGSKGDKDIPISSITAIQLKEPGSISNGYIQFNLSGGDTSTGGTLDATEDENSVMLSSSGHYEKAQKAKQIIEEQMYGDEAEPDAQTSESSDLADAEKIEKYHDLLEKGAISQEEFEEKKAEILGSGG